MAPKKQIVTTVTRVVTFTTTRTETKTSPPAVTCYRCGRRGHYSTACYAKSDTAGNSLDEEKEFECVNCDRTFTTQFGCMVHERSCF